jgi:hypothetical protein
MAIHPLTLEYLSSRYTLTSSFPVCCRRAWYKARVHPLARDPSELRRRWLGKRFPKRPNAGVCPTSITFSGGEHCPKVVAVSRDGPRCSDLNDGVERSSFFCLKGDRYAAKKHS